MAKILGEKKLNGVVYTPEWIVRLILDNVGYTDNICEKTIVDPACGGGAFLKEVVARFIEDSRRADLGDAEIKSRIQKNIVGVDIDKVAIKTCASALNDIANGYGLDGIRWNLLLADSLHRPFAERFSGKFDFVVGNPPYVRIQHLGKIRREKLQSEWRLNQAGSTDIFIAFFEMGFYLLSEHGSLGYITPNTYLKTKAGGPLRKFIIHQKALKTLIDFEHNQLFDNATTYSLITILERNRAISRFSLFKGDTTNIRYVDEIALDNLNDQNWILASNEVLKKLSFIQKRGLPLSKLARIHVGVTTLADDYYIFQNPQMDVDVAIIALKDGRSFPVEKSILKPIIKASVLKNAAEVQNRFIIFPYRKLGGRHRIIPELELKRSYPLTYRYFSEVRDVLDARDKGRPNPIAWYAFGRSQGLDTSFGKKILTSPMNLKPNFIVWEKEEYTFYAGYCIKFDGDLNQLARYLNSEEMEFYVNYVSRDYQNNYKSYAKSFIEGFGIEDGKLLSPSPSLF